MIERILDDPGLYQKRLLMRILKNNESCAYGKKYNFGSLDSYEAFAKTLPVIEYDDISDDINSMMKGSNNVLSSSRIDWFAKSSGTSTGRSKYIPVNENYLVKGHLKCAWDAASFIYDEDPQARLFADRSLIMGGSFERLGSGKYTGDISAIIIKHFPAIGKSFYTPDFETALMDDWDEKIKRMASICSKQNVTLIAGVPSWLMVLFDEILEQTKANNMSEIWPNARSFLHGGVNFEPYREQFRNYLPDNQIRYREVYNASEGYFAIQNHSEEDGMVLLCDNEIFYEFQEWDNDPDSQKQCVGIENLEQGKTYALIITNSSGLYRYKLGDLITVVATDPVKIKVTGRTRSMINVFGEELSVANTDTAISKACSRHEAEILEYTVAPVFSSQDMQGAHEWLIEFKKAPADIEGFKRDLDSHLREINSDYDAKRSYDLVLRSPVIKSLSENSFEKWQRQNERYGGQNKVPRLRNDRKLVESILNCISSTN